MENFQEFNLPEALNKALAKMNYSTPTPIQAKAIPIAMNGGDVLGSAQTGTGKTAAFSIPLVAKLMTDKESAAIILTPTRELAVQVMGVIRDLIKFDDSIKAAILIGGEPYPKQLQQLRRNPRIIVGTPGRINDHLNRKTCKLSKTNFLVLDETDRMLDMGFGIQIDEILKFMPKEKQTLLFSATMPSAITRLANKYLTKPERIAIGSATAVAKNVKQDIIHVKQAQKYDTLLEQLEKRTGSVIVFVKTKRSAENIADKLISDDHSADAIHGDLRQRQRDNVIKGFRNQRYRVMVATDIAARGLDIPHIEHVINYDLPQCPEDYIHRIGRTARAGAEGESLCIISPDDKKNWVQIHRMLNPGEPNPYGNDYSERKSPKKKRFGGSSSRSNRWNKDKSSEKSNNNGKKTTGNRNFSSKPKSSNRRSSGNKPSHKAA